MTIMGRAFGLSPCETKGVTLVAKYRKKPVVIEAWKWEGQPAQERPDWVNESGAYLTFDGKLVIPTLEGDHFASPGDYIIRGVKGEVYPCKPDIFETTYEPVPDMDPDSTGPRVGPGATVEELDKEAHPQ